MPGLSIKVHEPVSEMAYLLYGSVLGGGVLYRIFVTASSAEGARGWKQHEAVSAMVGASCLGDHQCIAVIRLIHGTYNQGQR